MILIETFKLKAIDGVECAGPRCLCNLDAWWFRGMTMFRQLGLSSLAGQQMDWIGEEISETSGHYGGTHY